jgi:Icc-related predicted phosphoesterase
MASQRVTRVLCLAEPRGSADALERVLSTIEEHDVQAVAVVGDLTRGDGAAESYRSVFRGLASAGLPTYWVPGPGDAPVERYLREAHNIEIVFPFLHGVHGTAAFAPGYMLFAGLGGDVTDDPDGPRDERERLRYPRWEAEYRLKLVRELPEHQLVLLFATNPAHKGLGTQGSEALAELVGTHRPRLVVCGGERGTQMLGRSLVVAPGSLAEGHYAIADVHAHEAQHHELAAAAGRTTA